MVEGVFRKAAEYSAERSDRDTKALLWTVKSLTDDTEFEPFIEAIPELLWDAQGQRRSGYGYDNHMRRLMDPEIQLLHRIHTFLQSSRSDLLTFDASKRRQIACYKAIWALSSLAIPGAFGAFGASMPEIS
jgi:hypothetical protein